MPGRILLEVCVASLDDARTAVAGGADRLELNTALTLGGLTPSVGLVAEVRRHVSIPIIAMIRPRAGGFHYSAPDFEVMLRDAEAVIAAGADGVAFGVLTADGNIDLERCRRLLDRCGHHEAVFHRAFDVTPDPFAALEAAIDLGFDRVMTSGQAGTAQQGAGLIAELLARAGGRIEVLPAGGINGRTAPDLVARTGCRQVHASARGTASDTAGHWHAGIRFGASALPPEGWYDRTDPDVLAALRAALTG